MYLAWENFKARRWHPIKHVVIDLLPEPLRRRVILRRLNRIEATYPLAMFHKLRTARQYDVELKKLVFTDQERQHGKELLETIDFMMDKAAEPMEPSPFIRRWYDDYHVSNEALRLMQALQLPGMLPHVPAVRGALRHIL